MFTYTGKMRSRYVTSASTITLETLDGEPVTMPSPFVVSNGYITFTVASTGKYRVRVRTPNSHYSYQIEVTESAAQVTDSLSPKAVAVATGNEARPVGSDIVMWIGGSAKPVNMQNNDIWFKTGASIPDTSDTTAPSAPTGLTSSVVTANGFTLSWTPSSDDVGVVGYDILLDSVVIASTSAATASLSGLTPQTAYSAAVRAKDAAGNLSEPSTALSVTTAGVSGTPQHSIWGNDPYPYAITKATDSPLTLGTGFYSYGTTPDVSAWRVVGAKLWVPTGVTLAGPLEFKVWQAGQTVTATHPDFASTPAATATMTTITAGTWNSIMFNVPVETNAGDLIWIAYRSGSGEYLGLTPATPDAYVTALDGSHIVQAEHGDTNWSRSYFRMDGGATGGSDRSVYGIDVIYDEGP